MWNEHQGNDNHSNTVTAIVCPPPTPTVFVKGDGMRVTGLWFRESVNQSAGYNETSHLRYLCILGLLVPKCPLSISDQHCIFFTREYTVEKFIEEHLSSQTGLLLAPCAWCETTNISLKTVSLLNRKLKVTEQWRQTDSYLHTFHETLLLPTHTAAQCHTWFTW